MRTAFALLAAAFAALAPAARAEIAVVVHPDSPLRELSRQEVSDLYLGRLRRVAGSPPVLVLDQPRDSEIRRRFFLHLNGMALARVNAYWARLQFSGDALPPATVVDDRNVIAIVRRHPEAIGYVDAAAADDTVRVVLRLDER